MRFLYEECLKRGHQGPLEAHREILAVSEVEQWKTIKKHNSAVTFGRAGQWVGGPGSCDLTSR